MQLCNARNKNQGFTLIETLFTLIIIGILAAIAAPSFLAMLNRNKVSNALTQVRGALQEAQREAVRKSQSCTVTIDATNKKVAGPCLVTGDRTLNSSVGLESNETSIKFSYRGTINLSGDGTVVFFTEDNPNYKKCLAISSPLGIIRSGKYTGQIPSDAAHPILGNSCEK